ncbi:acetyltransferase-like isoleucine patch superfamily enzyme [Arthrobacter sp. UYCu512]|uniref:acyltransferase n=1 Tax=Arthrobacter sp. UYCu512 TaxID=3156338 RepID=UPI003396DE53
MPKVTVVEPLIDASGNQIVGTPRSFGGSASVDFRGRNCKLIIHEGVVFQAGIQFLQDDAVVEIGPGCVVRGAFQLGRGASIVIGRKLDVTGNLIVVVDDGQTVSIGDDCLFAAGVNLRAYDNHPIYDLRTGKRTNYSRPISIGSNVWLGFEAAVMAGGVVPDGCIVGLRSIVTATSKLERHTLAVGQPARVVKRYVTFAKNGNPPADTIDVSHYPDAHTIYEVNHGNPAKWLRVRTIIARRLSLAAEKISGGRR